MTTKYISWIHYTTYNLQKREWFREHLSKSKHWLLIENFQYLLIFHQSLITLKFSLIFDQFKNWTMEDQIIFITFLVCMVICNSISLILYKYQKTISPINQSIIDKLSFFCIFCLNLINSNQVGLEQENNKVTTFFYFRD